MAQKDSFVFYRSFYEAAKHLDAENKAALLDAIIEFALNHKQSELPSTAAGMFCLIKPQLEANYRKAVNGNKGGKYGKLGGRPKREITPEKPLENPIGVIGENPTQTPNANVNANANVNENGNVAKFPPDILDAQYHQAGRIRGLAEKEIDKQFEIFKHHYNARTNKDIADWFSVWQAWLARVPDKKEYKKPEPRRTGAVDIMTLTPEELTKHMYGQL